MAKIKIKIDIAMLIVLAVFILVAFFIPFVRNAVFWVALGFGAFAILIQLFVADSAFHDMTSATRNYYGFPVARIGLVYMLAQIALSFASMAFAAVIPVKYEILLFLLVFATAAVGYLGADTMRGEIERMDSKLSVETSRIRKLRAATAPLAERCQDEAARKAVWEVADAFRFSDPVSSKATIEIEDDLENAVAGLRFQITKGRTEEIVNTCRDISALLQERNELCKLGKKK